MHLFKGSENKLCLKQEINIEFICHYALQWFPFDTQVYRMEFASRQHFTKFKLDHLEHNPDISLDRYTIR